MNWIKKHINIVWSLFATLYFLTAAYSGNTIPFYITEALLLIVTIWALYQKKRSYAWVIIPISVLFLQNHEQIAKEKEWKRLKLNSSNYH